MSNPAEYETIKHFTRFMESLDWMKWEWKLGDKIYER